MNPRPFYHCALFLLLSFLIPLFFISDALPQKKDSRDLESRFDAAWLSLVKVQMDGNLQIEEYSSNPTIVLVDPKFWQSAGAAGKTSLVRDLITFFQGKQLKGRYDYVSIFVVFDKKSRTKLAQGNVKTGEINIFP